MSGTSSGAAAELVVGHTAFGIARWHRGAFADAAEHLDEAGRLLHDVGSQAGNLQLFGADPIRLAAPFAVYVHELIGDRTDAECDAGYLAAIGLYPNDLLWEMVVMSFAASAAVSTGRPDRVLRWTARARTADPEGVSSYWNGMIQVYQGAAMCLDGNLDSGLALLDEAVRDYRDGGLHTNVATWLATRALALARAGRCGEATSSLADAQRELGAFGEEFATSTVELADGVLAHTRGEDPSVVRLALENALDVALSQGAVAMAERVRREARVCEIDLGR